MWKIIPWENILDALSYVVHKEASMKTIAERLRWARERRGHSCAGLDEMARLSCGHVAKIERGGSGNPSMGTVTKLASALDVAPQWLMFGGARPQIAKAS